jgi:hypothetical protein
MVYTAVFNRLRASDAALRPTATVEYLGRQLYQDALQTDIKLAHNFSW